MQWKFGNACDMEILQLGHFYTANNSSKEIDKNNFVLTTFLLQFIYFSYMKCMLC